MKIRLPGNLYLLILTATLILWAESSFAQGVYRFWGMTRQGGQHNTGVLFQLDSNANNYTVKHDFRLSNPGASPYHTRLTEWNGKYYGVTIGGGDNNNYGVIFEWDPVTNAYTDRFSFSGEDCWFVYGSLTLYNNKFYGMTNRGGDFGVGVIFEWDPATNNFSKLYHFSDESGHSPEGSLTLHNNKLYGMTRAGGDYWGGTIFRFDPSTNQFDKKYSFDYTDGRGPHGDLTMMDGKFYGLTYDGGANGYGVLFEWKPFTNQYNKRHDFDGDNGRYPYGSLTRFQDKLYGLTSEGGDDNAGVLFEFDPANNNCTKKLSFGGINGSYPYGSLTAADNSLAGMTWIGGPDNYGQLFEFDPSTNIIINRHEFGNQADGTNPLGSLVWDGQHFYGMTSSGGAANSGVIFKWDATNDLFEKKIDFNIAENGSLPQGNLVKWGGKLYGATAGGGLYNKGVLFSFDERTGTFNRIYDFDGQNGAKPTGDLIVHNGRLYGWTREGGLDGRGALFAWDIEQQTIQLLHSFQNSTGSYPSAGPLFWNNKFYGTTTEGGVNGYGVIYEFDPSTSTYTKRFDFDNTHGSYPTGYLAVRDNVLFGTTTYGGNNGTGVIYQWNPANSQYEDRYHFEIQQMGVHPHGGLVLNDDGSLFYGMTRYTNGDISFPGQEGPGVLYAFNPATGAYTKKLDFDGDNGGLPVGNLSKSGGKYYAMTNQGGIGESFPGINYIIGGSGVIFEWDDVTNNIEKKVDLLGDNGAYPSGNDLARTSVPVATGTANNCEAVLPVVIDATNNNRWVPLVDNNGNVVAEINANGNNLGHVSASIYVNAGDVREDNKQRLYLDRSITISPAMQPATAVSVRLYIRRQEYLDLRAAINSQGHPAGINHPAELQVFKMDIACGDAMDELANRQVATFGNWAEDFVYSVDVTSFSTFFFAAILSAEGPLPVEFRSFTAVLQNDDALLKWETSGEREIERYDVERSIDGLNFDIIGSSPAYNTNGTHLYTYTDAKATSLGVQKVYYRIREVDFDGRVTYSSSAMISLPEQPVALNFFPNPVAAGGQLKLQSNRNENLLVRLLDNNGRTIRQFSWQTQPGTNYLPVNTQQLSAGIYLLEIRSTEWKKTVRILKQ